MSELRACDVLACLLLALGIGACESPPNRTAPAAVGSATITSGQVSQPSETPEMPGGAPQSMAGGPGTLSLSDDEIVGAAGAAIDVVTDQAREELRNGKNAQARQLAQRIVDELGASANELKEVRRTEALAQAPSPTSDELVAGGGDILATMRSSTALDNLFVDARVSEGQRLIDLLDARLIPQAHDADLRHFLRTLRSTVVDEVTTARGLQQTMTP